MVDPDYITAFAAFVAAGTGILASVNIFYRLTPLAVRSGNHWHIYNRNKSHPVVIRKIFNETSTHLTYFRCGESGDSLLPKLNRFVYWEIPPGASLDVGFVDALKKTRRDSYGGVISAPIEESICQPMIERKGIILLACFTATEFDIRLKEHKCCLQNLKLIQAIRSKRSIPQR